MDPRFLKARFSGPFNRLECLGVWPADNLSSHADKKLYGLKRILGLGILTTAITLQAADLYFVLGDIRKVAFNLSSSVILVGYTLKIILLLQRKADLDELRWRLWQDSLELSTESELEAMDAAYEKLKFIQHSFYGTCNVFLPILLISSYFSYIWGDRKLPFAAFLPMEDPLDDFYYLPALLFEGASAFYLIYIVIEGELSMFSLILQLKVYHEIFIANLKKINDIYGDEDDRPKRKKTSVGEINLNLKKANAKLLLKLSVIRHLELIQYIKKFEFIFSRCLFIQIYGCFLLIVMNGLELSLKVTIQGRNFFPQYFNQMSAKLCFQLAFFSGLMADLYFLSQELSNLLHQCLRVGEAAYSTVWYKMDSDIRSTLVTIMICSGKPSRITAGKFVPVDLSTYLRLLRNMYSWLTLMRQVTAK